MTRGITEITVEALFGRYDYQMRLPSPSTGAPHLSLLYGDNGTGKTTILKLVFHLLSSRTNRGHKSYVARVPFRRLTISLSDGWTITASRTRNTLIGEFDLELARRNRKSASATINVDPESGRVTPRTLSPAVRGLLKRITELSLDTFYLGDSRDLEGDTIPRPSRRRPAVREISPHFDEFDWVLAEATDRDHQESTLVESIRRAEGWLRTEAIRASSTGETHARQSYTEILRTIASTSTAPARVALREHVDRIQRKLGELEVTSRDFEEFGLGSVIDAGSLSEILTNSNDATLPVVVQVLDSFLDGQQSKLNALSVVYDKMHSFVGITNGYFSDKTVSFDIYSGLTIRVPEEALDPDLLSSGEKHLLLLFLNVFTPSEGSPVFIIDEPELSLNVKWQRRLIDSLLELGGHSHCQFIMATHSIELLSMHSDHVVRIGSHE